MLSRNTRFLQEDEIAAMFDSMASEYDDITDLWYSWLFCRLHYFLLLDMAHSGVQPGSLCLDVGCGTGFQSILLNLCGHNVVGIDLSRALLGKASTKDPRRYLTEDFFKSRYRFVSRYSKRIRQMARLFRRESPIGESGFRLASATKLPFPDNNFELLNCCGSTLSFIENYSTAIEEMHRVMKPGGFLFLEVENKYNLDLLWSTLDAKLFRGRIGFDTTSATMAANLRSKRSQNIRVNYPFSTKAKSIDMPIWLFSSAGLIKELDDLGFLVKGVRGIHSATNLLPSVILDSASPSICVRTIFGALAKIEELTSSWPTIRRLGCSLVIAATKR